MVFPVPAAVSVGLKGIVGAAFVLVSAPLLLMALSSLGKIAWFAATGEVATARVYASEGSGGSRGTGSRPVARFVDAAGKVRVVAGEIGLRTSLTGRRRLTHAIGTTVRIAYPHGQPARAMFADGKTITWMVISVMFLALFPAIGVLLIRSDRRELREQGMIA